MCSFTYLSPRSFRHHLKKLWVQAPLPVAPKARVPRDVGSRGEAPALLPPSQISHLRPRPMPLCFPLIRVRHL